MALEAGLILKYGHRPINIPITYVVTSFVPIIQFDIVYAMGAFAGIVMLFLRPRATLALSFVLGIPLFVQQLLAIFQYSRTPIWYRAVSLVENQPLWFALAVAAVLLINKADFSTDKT